MSRQSLRSEKIFKIKKLKKWTTEEDEIIKNMTLQKTRKKWKNIKELLTKKSAVDCIARYKTTCFNQGKWTPEEDKVLLKFHSVLGNNWAAISRLIKVRNWKQVRDRYTNHLDPDICQESFSQKEDELVSKLHQVYGTRWSLYLQYMANRTADQIKNRFNSTIKRKIKSLNTSTSTVSHKVF
jgi:hypothetical protein